MRGEEILVQNDCVTDGGMCINTDDTCTMYVPTTWMGWMDHGGPSSGLDFSFFFPMILLAF